MKTNELTGAALDWAVSIAEGFKPAQLYINKWPNSPASIYTRTFDDEGKPDGYMTGPNRLYSHKWEAGGPIIEREGISIVQQGDASDWVASVYNHNEDDWHLHTNGSTPLIAAMRCFVASKLGDDVKIPLELTNQ